VGEDRPQTSRQRVTVAQAAEILGVTVEAVRGRIKRGTLEHERHSGTVYVLLDADQSTNRSRPDADQTAGRLQSDSGALISEMHSRIQFLEDELQRKDAILLNMTEAMKALSPPSQETPSEEREPPVSPGPSDAPTEASTDAQEGVRRPWWRRLLGR
jgi:hypothetical protein